MSDAPLTAPILFQLSPGVEFSTRVVADRTSFVAHHAELGKYFRFGAEEHHVVSLIDGSRSAKEIHACLEADGIGWTQQETVDFIGQLVQHKIVATVTPPVGDAETHPSNSAATTATTTTPQADNSTSQPHRPTNAPLLTSLTSLLAMMISQRIPLLDGQRVAASVEPTVGRLFSSRGVIACLFLVASALGLILGNLQAFHAELRRLFDPAIWPVLIGIWLVAKVVHEIGHGVAAARQGVRVGKMGVMFFLCAPLAYVDVTDAWKLRGRFQRVQIALAGVYLEITIAALAAWAWWLLPGGLLRHLAAQIFLITGPTTLLVNANPLLRLDGYYVISDLLEIPNLRMHGRKQLGAKLEHWLIGITPKQSLLYGWRRSAATVHAAASVLFQFFWMGGLIIAVSMWAQGLGILLSVAAFLLWGLIPLSRWVHKIWTLDPPEKYALNAKRKRLLTIASILVALVHYLSTTTSPLDRRVPVVVRFHNEQISRAATDAFVDIVHVRHGQRVEKGDVLMELNQPELMLEVQAMQDDLELALKRSQQNRRNGNIALADAKSQEADSLRRRIAVNEERVAGLRIVATRDGLINTPNLRRMTGRYVRQGDELVRVSDPNEKELLSVVSERDVQAYQLATKQQRPAKIRLRGGTQIKAVPQPIRPRARMHLPHPAMSALAGGPLAVQPSDDPDHPVQLVDPQLQSVTPLDPMTSAMVSVGQLGAMTISDDRPLVSRLYDALRFDAKRTLR